MKQKQYRTHRLNKILYLLNLLFLSTFISNTQAAAIDSLKAFVSQTKTVRADFSQVLLDKNTRALQESTGTMLFERPGKFRWTYTKPYEQLIVGDGDKIWFYDQDLNQVTIRKLDISIGSTPAALLAGSSTIEENFTLVEMGQQDQIEWLQATPIDKESIFEHIRIGFSLDGLLKIMAIRDHFGQTTLLTFSGLEKNPQLSNKLFQFTPPDGADVISE